MAKQASYERILSYFSENGNRKTRCDVFNSILPDNRKYWVGRECGTRVGDMVRSGILETEKDPSDGRYSLYWASESTVANGYERRYVRTKFERDVAKDWETFSETFEKAKNALKKMFSRV